MSVQVLRFKTCCGSSKLHCKWSKRRSRETLKHTFIVKAEGDSKAAESDKSSKSTDVITGEAVDTSKPEIATKKAGEVPEQKQKRMRKTRLFIKSDGNEHLGSSMTQRGTPKKFPGPPPGSGPPLRVLPIGGLGEIGMNCMLVGVGDRYILIDAGLMFPDFTDYGMQKILPDTSFLAQWKDRIEALIITHGHEDHIGALPWVVPALDRKTPIYSSSFVMQLVKRRLQEFNIYDDNRCKVFEMRKRFRAGPFEVEPIRVTHSIPDCCGMILRSEAGNIVHTGDFKIDENPLDEHPFDREALEQIGKEGVTLLMSDSTNALAPGKTVSESTVRQSIIERVLRHKEGRIVATQFASNLHRLGSMKAAADASGRKICFIGTALNVYMEAAFKDGRAPFDPRSLVQFSELDEYDPSELLIVTTGSQGEERAALQLASIDQSPKLKFQDKDLILYSAKVIPGNDTKVMQMMNRISQRGPKIAMGRGELLHSSGHAYREELSEVLKLVKPQHFLPVHGEYAFLTAHAELAQDLGIKHVEVIRNGEMLGVEQKRNNDQFSSISGLAKLGEAQLQFLYNDGFRGTGNRKEMCIDERQKLAHEGVVVIAVDIIRKPVYTKKFGKGRKVSPKDVVAMGMLECQVKLTSRGMWTDGSSLLVQLHKVVMSTVTSLRGDASLAVIEHSITKAVVQACYRFNNKNPDVLVIAHEQDPRAASILGKSQVAKKGVPQKSSGKKTKNTKTKNKSNFQNGSNLLEGISEDLQKVPAEVLAERKQANPRETATGVDDEYDMTYG